MSETPKRIDHLSPKTEECGNCQFWVPPKGIPYMMGDCVKRPKTVDPTGPFHQTEDREYCRQHRWKR